MKGSTNYNDPEDKLAELTESYRLISLLPLLLKLFKKLLLSRVSIVMESHELIPDHQFGFRSKQQSKYTEL